MALQTFGDCVNEVLNYGFADGPQVNKKRIETWINEAQRVISRKVEAPEFQALESRALTQGTYQYSLPEGFLRMESIYAPALSVRLRPVDQQSFDRNNPVIEGIPLIYAVRENQFWVFPTPGQTEGTGKEEGLKLRYLKAPATLLNETDIPTLNSEYLHILVDYALWRAFGAEDDSEQAQFHENIYKRTLDEYATDVQRRDVDRPRQVDGTWGSGVYGQGGWF